MNSRETIVPYKLVVKLASIAPTLITVGSRLSLIVTTSPAQNSVFLPFLATRQICR